VTTNDLELHFNLHRLSEGRFVREDQATRTPTSATRIVLLLSTVLFISYVDRGNMAL
jgi:hypothetical protein